jgi:enoyl-CoA hydratase/carnithine racemase
VPTEKPAHQHEQRGDAAPQPADEAPPVRVAVAGHVMTVTLDRPHRLNAFTGRMAVELIEAFDRADADDTVRAVVVTGAGRGFCAGADLAEGGATFDHDARANAAAAAGERSPLDPDRDRGGLVALRIFASTKPVIGAINGPAVGVGATMTLPMDVRLASSTARFGFVFARRGIVPEAASSWFLPRVVGISRATEWAVTGRVFDADEALAGGLVRSVHEPDDLMPAAYELAAEIADNTAPVSVALTRQMMWRMLGADHPMEAHRLDSRAIIERGRSADAREGVTAFLERRPADFPDRVSTGMPGFWPWWPDRPFTPLAGD